MKLGDLVILTNHNITEGEWPEEYVNELCKIIDIEEPHKYSPIVVECLGSELIAFRKKFGGNARFNAPASGFFNLEHISPDNRLLRLIL